MLDKNGGIKMEKDLRRGEIYWAELPDSNGTSIQTGYRPVLIVSNNAANSHSPVIHVIPLTTSLKKSHLPTHVELVNTKLSQPTMALAEALCLIEKKRIKRKITNIHPEDMNKVVTAMLVQVGALNTFTKPQLKYA